MRSVLLQTTTRFAYPGIITFSFFMFFRGHNSPGGGFVGGLLASAGILLVYIAFGMREGDRVYNFNYRSIAFFGLICAAIAGVLPMFSGRPFLTSIFRRIEVPGIGALELSTVLLFDFGVFLVVLGTIVGIVKTLVLEQQHTAHHSEDSD